MSAQEKFDAAVKRVRGDEKPSHPPSQEDKLTVYALYKQATEGDVQGSQPYAIQFEARAKWDAWNKLKGMSKEEAMEKYADEVNKQFR